MTDALLQPGEIPLDNAHDSAHYLRSVTDMAERCAVVTEDAIYSENGIKLVEKGARIDSRMYDRLIQHKLRQPVDMHLTVENAVTLESVRQGAQDLLESGSQLSMLKPQVLGPAQLLAPLQYVVLPARMGFKLTVMREQMPDLYTHSLRMMLVSLYLGVCSQLDERECARLAAAALLHDLGALHMDPAWRDPRNKPSGVARKHLIAHPITAMLMVRDAQVYSRAVEQAILEHHERMDGTGYPRGVQGKDISLLGQILLLAEVVAAFFEKYKDNPAQQLALMLRLNHRKFPAALVAHVLPHLDSEAHGQRPAGMPTHDQFMVLGAQLVQAFAQWDQAKAAMPAGHLQAAGSGPLAFIDQQLGMLKRALTEAGAHPEHHQALLEQLHGDEQGISELAYVVREALWQLESIVNHCQRRWPEEQKTPGEPAAQAAAQWCAWVRSLGTKQTQA